MGTKAIIGMAAGLAIGLAVGVGGTVAATGDTPVTLEMLYDDHGGIHRLLDHTAHRLGNGHAETTEHVLRHEDDVTAQLDNLREIIEGHHGQVIDACEAD